MVYFQIDVYLSSYTSFRNVPEHSV